SSNRRESLGQTVELTLAYSSTPTRPKPRFRHARPQARPSIPAVICSKQFCEYCIIGLMPMNVSLCASREAFLDFCRIEKGLASNSLDAYKRDLARLEPFAATACSGQLPGSAELLAYLDSLYRERLGARSIARHLSTI